jgi:hypothetical protein
MKIIKNILSMLGVAGCWYILKISFSYLDNFLYAFFQYSFERLNGYPVERNLGKISWPTFYDMSNMAIIFITGLVCFLILKSKWNKYIKATSVMLFVYEISQVFCYSAFFHNQSLYSLLLVLGIFTSLFVYFIKTKKSWIYYLAVFIPFYIAFKESMTILIPQQ